MMKQELTWWTLLSKYSTKLLLLWQAAGKELVELNCTMSLVGSPCLTGGGAVACPCTTGCFFYFLHTSLPSYEKSFIIILTKSVAYFS